MHRRKSDEGFTLIELSAAMVLFGILATVAVASYRSYQRAHDEQGTADAVVSALRNLQERSSSESRTYCLRFGTDATSWTVWRTACGSGTQISGGSTDSARVTLPVADRSFVDRTGATSTSDVYFYRSGMSSAGSLKVRASGRSKVYTIRVEGLTGRVSVS